MALISLQRYRIEEGAEKIRREMMEEEEVQVVEFYGEGNHGMKFEFWGEGEDKEDDDQRKEVYTCTCEDEFRRNLVLNNLLKEVKSEDM